MKLSDDDIIQATCAVLIEGKVKGTAWLVSEEGHLLTAGHLLGTENPRETVEVRFPEDIPQTAHKILWGYQRDMGIDFSVLKLATPPAKRHPLPICIARYRHRNLPALWLWAKFSRSLNRQRSVPGILRQTKFVCESPL